MGLDVADLRPLRPHAARTRALNMQFDVAVDGVLAARFHFSVVARPDAKVDPQMILLFRRLACQQLCDSLGLQQLISKLRRKNLKLVFLYYCHLSRVPGPLTRVSFLL